MSLRLRSEFRHVQTLSTSVSLRDDLLSLVPRPEDTRFLRGWATLSTCGSSIVEYRGVSFHRSDGQAICGDGLLVVGEECDDGNQVLFGRVDGDTDHCDHCLWFLP